MSQKVFIFDLDGLLVDSEPSHFKAYRDILASYGVFINRSEFIDGWLSGEQYGMKLYLGKVGISDPGKIALIRAKKKEYFLKLAKGKLRAMSGVKEFLEKALADGIKCGVGTGAYHEEYNFMLEQCGLASYFSRCVGGDEVIFNKPAPDIFLGVADYFGV
ncbi:MAG: Hydrolase, partial [Candidatus Peregrinibacteria bacterium GW2011_GWE2_39_6]